MPTTPPKRGAKAVPDPKTKSRLIELDVLRCLAIVLVLFAHITHLDLDEGQSDSLTWLMPVVLAGWIGVPIFFVLSGFLIAHILIKEHDKNGRISYGRFFIRRGFKIYPAFYLCIGLYTLGLIAFEDGVEPERLLRELFFLQNYGSGGLLDVTWSLAVEEHFYILFPITLILLARWQHRRGKIAEGIAAFRPIIPITIIISVICLIFRIDAQARFPGDELKSTFPTHLRIDGLFIGAVLGYLYNANHDRFARFFRASRAPGLVVAAAIYAMASLSYPGLLDFFRTYYILLLSLASFLLLGIALSVKLPQNPPWRAVAYVGAHSYSIYLFHIPFIRVLNRIIGTLGLHLPGILVATASIGGSIIAGILVSKLVEFPALRLRDRLFPARVDRYFPGSESR